MKENKLIATKLTKCRGRMAKFFISFPHPKSPKHFLESFIQIGINQAYQYYFSQILLLFSNQLRSLIN